MAAVSAARIGDRVTVFEKNSMVGRKLNITGKGRCNVTNNCTPQTVIANTPTNGRFLYSALHRFSPADTIAFFEKNGLPLKTERGNRVFPVSDKAADVVNTLRRAAEMAGARIEHHTVTGVTAEHGHVTGVEVAGRRCLFDKVIIACGGCSYPLTGSTGDGYRFAAALGHTIRPLKPSLVPLETVERMDPGMNKLLMKNLSLTLWDTAANKKLYTDFGELQFMRYGVSGATVLSASSHIREMTEGRYRLVLDFKPALSEEKLDARLLREIDADKGKNYAYLLHSLLPAAMVEQFVRMSGIPGEKRCSELSRNDRRRILQQLKSFTLTIRGFRPLEEAIVTSGGVDVREIDPRTMESKLVKGLYVAGEVIDVDCYTGGFNLQAAFSTGVLAGEN